MHLLLPFLEQKHSLSLTSQNGSSLSTAHTEQEWCSETYFFLGHKTCVVCTQKTSHGIVLFIFCTVFLSPQFRKVCSRFDVQYKNTKWDSGERLEMNKVNIFTCINKCAEWITWEETLEETKIKKRKTVLPWCSTMTRIHDELPSWVCYAGQPASECSECLFQRACVALVKCRLLSSNQRLNPALACFPSCSVFLPLATWNVQNNKKKK